MAGRQDVNCPPDAEGLNAAAGSTDSLVAAIATTSRLLVMDEAERARTLATIRAFLDRQPETSAGEFRLPRVTVALRAARRA